MKRLTLIISLLVSVLSAGAWNKTTYATIMALASQHLTTEAASVVKGSLNGDFSACVISDKANHLFVVDENYAPLRNDDKSALVVAEECVERIRQSSKDGEAILLLAKAVADMHSVPNIRIKGNDFSHNNYTVRRWNNRNGRMARYKNVKWRAMWNSYFPGRHYLFTPELYAYDIELYHARYRGAFVEGGLAEWANDVAKEYRAIYSENLADMHILTQERVNEYEYIHDRLMAKAAYRLATLLNSILK